MRPTTPLQLLGARLLSALVAWTMTFGPITSAYGATTPLADVPIAAKVSAKPNIIYTLDDSGSMQYNYLPDYVVNAAANIAVSLTRQGPISGKYRARTSSSASITNISVGDWVNVIGANQAEYNGFFQVINKPTTTTLEYEVGPVAATPITVAAGYGNIQIVTSAAYCKTGNGTTTCAQQAVAINSSGNSVIQGNTITRPAPLSSGGTVTATLTNTAANLAPISTGDAVTISNSSTSATLPGNTSNPYYGTFIVTKISPTQLTYQITAIANNTPLSAASNKYILFGGSTTFAAPPLHAADFNRLAYNPSVTYAAPKKADGTPLTNTGTDAQGNYAYNAVKWASASVDRDPYASYEVAAGVTPMWTTATKDNLNIRVAVQLYCNTDWPLLENDMNWSAGPNGATALDAGDINGQYQTGKGAWCRINGTKYDLSSASGAPATAVSGVEMGYNYPWQASTAGVKAAQYFYQQLSVKTLWCDKTSPYWPRSGVIIGCVGGTFNAGSTVSQYCHVTGSSTACTGSYPTLTYKDNAAPTNFCDNSATFCSPPGTGSAPECRPCTCVPNTPTTVASCYRSDTNAAGSGSCGCTGTGCTLGTCGNFTITAASCTGGTPIYQNTPATSANCTSFLWDPVTGTNTTTTLLQDAGVPAAGASNTSGAPGTTCRHNNYTYSVGGAAGLFKYSSSSPAYPGEGAGTGLFNTAVQSGCPAVGTTVQIPRHYYVVDSVDFCSDRNVTADAQWRGFGTGACASSNDLQHFKEVKYGKFVRVDLFPSNALAFPGAGSFAADTIPYPNGRTWLAGTSPDPNNSESINYANWYAYYSTRLLAGKTTSATAFSYLTNVPPDPIGYRVGFHNLGEEPATYGGFGTPIIWQDVNDWDQTQRNAWYDKLFGVAVNNYKTPTLDAMMRIGNLVETGGASGLPPSINPLPAGAADPFPINPATGLRVSCTNNYHILFTDGKTNQVTPITTPGDQDAVVPTSIAAIPTVAPDYVLGYLGPLSAANAPWPRPFVQGTAVPNTLADVAAYYWTRDLRSLNNDVPASSSKAKLVCIDSIASPCPPAAKVPEPVTPYCSEPSSNPCPPAALVVPTIPNDLDPSKDVAWWQHVNFSAISFGAEGTLSASNQAATMASIRAGTLNWPDLTQPNNPIYPKGAAQGAVAVDDLWHATAMSRGSFVYARSPIEVAYGLANILAGIQNQRKSRTGAAFSGQVLNAGNNVIFEPTIEPGWAGDLLKVEINPATGAEVQTWWQASQTLAAQIDPAAAGVAEPWMLPAHRRIVTSTSASGPGVAFQWANLTSAQLLSLAPDATTQKKIVSYLRGGNTWTDSVSGTVYDIEGTAVGQFRKRFGPLGDLSNAQPVVVTPPNRTYVDTTDPGYTTYVTNKASRATIVVAPANDGMVHVFDAGPMPQEGPPVVPVAGGGGNEIFAYVPKALFKGVAGTVSEDASGIQALTYQDGGVPIYKHHMYVDSSPRVADVDFGGPDWRTIVVGGLGKGGNSYYALDLTNATAVDETAASGKFLWEWSNSEVKYSYGRPVIVKVRDAAYPKGRWVVIVTGGYDNASGKGKVFFLDAKTGTLLSTVTTSEGAPPGSGQAAGLAQVHAFVHDKSNQIAEQIYGGDLLGNVWRIDVSATDSYLTASAVLFAQLTDPSSAAQPVTVAPQIEIDINNGIDRYVFIGTGRLLDSTDLTSPSPPQTQTMYAIRDGTLANFSTTGLPIQPRSTLAAINPDGVSAIASGAPNGWYHDLPNETDDSERIVVDPKADVNVAAYVGTMVQSDPCIISLPAKLYARDYTTAESLILNGSTLVGYADFPEGLVDIATVGMIQADGSQIIGILGSQEIPGTKPVRLVNKFIGQGSRLSWRLLGTQ